MLSPPAFARTAPRDPGVARRALDRWRTRLEDKDTGSPPMTRSGHMPTPARTPQTPEWNRVSAATASAARAAAEAQRYIRAGDIYQVNLAQRLQTPFHGDPWEFWQQLSAVSPAPFSACMDAGDFLIASVSPELFLRFSGDAVVTRPIKGTRPRHADPTQDAQLSYELQTSPKEHAELLMITDLLRNDLGRVCEMDPFRCPT